MCLQSQRLLSLLCLAMCLLFLQQVFQQLCHPVRLQRLRLLLNQLRPPIPLKCLSSKKQQ